MRKIIGALSLTSALIFTLAVHAAAPANFGGTWNLDKAKSQGLSQRMQGADSVTWTITQDDKSITVEEKVTGGQMGGPGGGGPPAGAPPAGGPPPGGGGGGGGGMGGGLGGPVERVVGQQLVFREHGLGVAVAVAPRAELLDDPGCQPCR